MKFVYPEIDHVFDTAGDGVPTLVIENPQLLWRLLSDIRDQLAGNDGRSVVSEDGTILSIGKSVELLTEFVPFTLNTKALVGKAAAALEKLALEESYPETMELQHCVESFLTEVSFKLQCDLVFPKITIGALIKAAGPVFREEYDSLAEKIIDYMELVTELDRRKLFVLYNLRSVISDSDTENFLATVRSHGYNVLMLESSEHTRLPFEQRYIVDYSLCEIC